ncbi:MAG: SDR family oxidoreductase [Planctomycetota bacterium]|jgi:3-oxoacyl-[acyl-carrier protein] reductase
MRDRKALVCGASSGIGRAAALALAAKGAEVTALARSEEKLASLVGEMEAAGGGAARHVAVDMQDTQAFAAAVRGLGTVHVLVNNTGGPPPGRLLDAEPEDLLTAFRRHVLAAHVAVGILLPGMREAGYGRIVNVISTSVREPIPNLGVSNTIRAAMAGWAKTLSGELPPGVTINNVLPGFTATGRLRSLGESIAERTGGTYEDVERNWVEQIPEGRLARPEELASVIAFLASEEAAYVRGQSIAVDGGRMRSI